VAAPVVCASARRAFVKAASGAVIEQTAERHGRGGGGDRSAASVAPALPGSVDEDGWVALVLADVEGAPPAVPWRDADVAAVLAALDALSRVAPPDLLRPAAEQLPVQGSQQLAADPGPLTPWERRHLDAAAGLAAAADRVGLSLRWLRLRPGC
jgi:hypothetical protein